MWSLAGAAYSIGMVVSVMATSHVVGTIRSIELAAAICKSSQPLRNIIFFARPYARHVAGVSHGVADKILESLKMLGFLWQQNPTAATR